ncbi:hypothetical protein FO519_001164 [Halicephalobus sp. NKZ332]|nr:hypothetical protein FO519_001164 [Halicephalobus sp. NKZ332]
MSENPREEIVKWRLGDSNFSLFFLLKILNRHCSDWTFGEDVRTLTKIPEVSWISEGKGFSSKIYSVKLFLEDNKEYEFCVKIPSAFHLEASIIAATENMTEEQLEEERQKARKMIAQAHSREVNFYKFSSKISPGFLKIPKFIYGRDWTKDQEGILMMEDFSKICKKEFVPRNPFTKSQVLSLIEEIAKIQIASITKENLVEDFPILENTVISMSKYAHLSSEILLSRNLDFFTEEIAEKILDLSRPSTLAYLLSYTTEELAPVLVHSAIWPGNVLWASESKVTSSQSSEVTLPPESEAPLVSIVDWQGCFVGSPTADLAALLAISVTGQERRLQEDEYIQHFVTVFNNLRNQSSEKGKIPILDFEIVKENYGKSLLYSAIELIIIIVTNPLDDIPEDPQTMGTMTQRLKFLIEDIFN